MATDSMKILIADDHVLFREALRQVVQQLGDEVVVMEAHDWLSTVELGKNCKDITLALVDLKMPGMMDFEGLEAFMGFAESVPVVIVSASENPLDMQRAFDVGAVGFIAKNEKLDVFLSALRLVLSGGYYVPQKLIQKNLSLSSRHACEPQFGLTPRQMEVLKVMSLGKSNKEIAQDLNLSEVTVKAHVSAIFKALKVTNRMQAVHLTKDFI